jgi:DNA-binding phage protein
MAHTLPNEDLARLLQSIHTERGLAQSQVARDVGIDRRTLGRAMRGEDISPSVRSKLEKYLEEAAPSESEIPAFLRRQAVSTEPTSVQVERFSNRLIRYLAENPKEIHQLTPRMFEELIAELLADMGAQVHLTPQSKDKGRDVLAAFDTPVGKVLTLVECKKYCPANPVGIAIVERFLYTVLQQDKASFGLIATTSTYTRDALRRAMDHKWQLQLKEFSHIQDWLSKYGSWTASPSTGIWMPNTPASK